jgi:hypothetical protein
MGENNFSLASCMMHESVFFFLRNVKVDVGLATSGLLLPWDIDSSTDLRTTGHECNCASEIIDGIIEGTIRQVRN